MPSPRGLILLLCLPALVSANLRLANLAAAPLALPPLALSPQAPGFPFDLYSALSPPTSTLTNLTGLPTDCASYVGAGNECTSSMTATAVNLADCGDAFTVCRCADATMSMDTVVDRLGRVPIGLRRYVGVVVVLNDTTPHAYTFTNGDIHLFGDCAMDTWIHEASHSFDFAITPPHSSSAGWQRALSTDSCAPDNYSLTNQVEDFAQISVLKTYMLLYDGHLPPGFRADCMAHQLDFMGSLPAYNASAFMGNTCQINDGMTPLHANANAPDVASNENAASKTTSALRPGIPLLLSSLVLAGVALLLGFPLDPHSPHDALPEVNQTKLTLRPQKAQLTFDLTALLPPAYPTLTQPLMPPPAGCTTSEFNPNECTAEMTALGVRFEDCGDLFTVCRCSDATMSMDTVIERLGRVPVGLRRYGGRVVVLKNTEADAHAYTRTGTGDIRLFGDCEMNLWVHEVWIWTRSIILSPADLHSSTREWEAALEADSCVPDDYAVTTATEDFAEVGVVKIYMLLHSGSMPPGLTANCMSKQLAFMDTLSLFHPEALFGNTCAIKESGPPPRYVRYKGSIEIFTCGFHRHTIPPATLDISRTFNPVPSSTNGARPLLKLSHKGKSLIMFWTMIISSLFFCVLAL
ncbi:hypothetical protein C8R43DRAFT_903486 [Mycena crocata]|nr:hypothetical protein C8R43DRAFT_903486 [Mycena crocata]